MPLGIIIRTTIQGGVLISLMKEIPAGMPAPFATAIAMAAIKNTWAVEGRICVARGGLGTPIFKRILQSREIAHLEGG